MAIDATRCFDGTEAPRERWTLRLHEWLLGAGKGDRGPLNPDECYPVAYEVLLDLVSRLGRLEAERQPFKVALDRAMKEGWPDGAVPPSVIEFAETLGLRARELKVGSDLVVEHAFVGRLQGRLASVRAPAQGKARVVRFRLEVLSEFAADAEIRTPQIDLASRDLAELATLGELVQYMGHWYRIVDHSGYRIVSHDSEPRRATLRLVEAR